jgi:hypothetical protein
VFLTPVTKAELDAFAARLDDHYLDLRDATDEGRATIEDYMPPFRQARAVSALSFAGDESALDAAMEAIYAAAATTENKDELGALIESALMVQGYISRLRAYGRA